MKYPIGFFPTPLNMQVGGGVYLCIRFVYLIKVAECQFSVLLTLTRFI